MWMWGRGSNLRNEESMMYSKQFAVISNISVEAFFIPFVQERFNKYGVEKINFIPYEECWNKGYEKVLREADYILIWLNLEILLPDLHNGSGNKMICEMQFSDVETLSWNIGKFVSSISNGMIIWITFEDYFLHLPMVTGHVRTSVADVLNLKVKDALSDNIIFLDLKYLIAELGICNAFEVKNKYRWSFPYSKALTMTAVDEIEKLYFIENGLTKKCLVLDCDNVLWGGVLSEDGLEGIKLGNSGLGWEYQEFQRFVLSLYYRGVILAICSKNELSDVLSMFREHSGMILKEDHIACFQVNWENKVDNIIKIAECLNIGIDSMVFVDDSSYEIEAVKAMLPDVSVIKYHRKMMYEKFNCFCLKDKFDYNEISARNKTYRTNVKRYQLKNASMSYRDYLTALEMKIDIHKTKASEYARIAELTQRTNKCTNGVRVTVADIKTLEECSQFHLYTVTLSDKFSDLGIVGAFGIQESVLYLFSLSCRALGREVENRMILFLKQHHQIAVINFQNTGRNESLKILLKRSFE